MKVAARIAGMVFLVVMLSACRRWDFQERTINLPGLKNQECATIVSNALATYARGPNLEECIKLDTIKFDFENRSVTFQYDSMKTEIKNLEHYLASLGFDANEIRADEAARAKLPPECR